jgi:hypothetical protein
MKNHLNYSLFQGPEADRRLAGGQAGSEPSTRCQPVVSDERSATSATRAVTRENSLRRLADLRNL